MTRKPLQGRPGGRPRKDDPSLRSEWLRARVRPDDLHRVEQLARDAGKTPSEYVRDASLTAQILIKRTRYVAPALLNELSRIGNNLNQIAKVCNTTGESRRARAIEIYLDELRPVLKRLYELQ
jgi:Bacterial mobilisation protein (MobC)